MLGQGVLEHGCDRVGTAHSCGMWKVAFLGFCHSDRSWTSPRMSTHNLLGFSYFGLLKLISTYRGGRVQLYLMILQGLSEPLLCIIIVLCLAFPEHICTSLCPKGMESSNPNYTC